MTRNVIVALALFWVGVSVSGGGGAPTAGGPEVIPPRIPENPAPAPSDPNSLRLPLDPYTANAPGDSDVIGKSLAMETVKCMKDRGFDYDPMEGVPVAAGRNSEKVRQAPFGINDIDIAASKGYSHGRMVTAAELAESGVKLPTAEELVQKHGQAWYDALRGPGKNCEAAGDHIYDAYGSIDKELPGRLAAQSGDLTASDKRVVDVVKQWSTCMSGKGYQYGSPTDAAKKKWPQGPTEEEKKTAVADVECKRSTKLADIWLAVETGYQQALLEKNADALKENQEAWRKIVDAATKIVAAG